MRNFSHRSWAEINIDNLNNNIKEIQKLLSDKTQILAVVKADCYGHTTESIIPALKKTDIKWFGVATIDEAIQLRRDYGVDGDILILGFTQAYRVKELAEYNITQAVYSTTEAQALNNQAVKDNVKINVHIKIDTGMSRIGFIASKNEEKLEPIIEIFNMPNLKVSGMFAHFACSDELSEDSVKYTKNQIDLFDYVIDKLKEKGYDTGLLHIQNSAGIINYDYLKYDLVRPGIILYGLNPSNELNKKINLKPVMELKTVVTMVKTVPANTAVSYGRNFVTKKETKLATIAIGYADGYPRVLSNKGRVLINGQFAPIAGNVCMDQIVVDVTDIPNVSENDVVTLFGRDGDNYIAIDEIAKLANTINYEIVCQVSKRVPRIIV